MYNFIATEGHGKVRLTAAQKEKLVAISDYDGHTDYIEVIDGCEELDAVKNYFRNWCAANPRRDFSAVIIGKDRFYVIERSESSKIKDLVAQEYDWTDEDLNN